MLHAIHVDKESQLVIMEDDDISIGIMKGRKVSYIGAITPAIEKKAYRIYHSIINKK